MWLCKQFVWLLNHTACIGNCTIALFKFYFLLYSYYTCFLALLLLLALLRYRRRSNSDTSVLIPCSTLMKMVALHPVVLLLLLLFFIPLFHPILNEWWNHDVTCPASCRPVPFRPKTLEHGAAEPRPTEWDPIISVMTDIRHLLV